MERAPNYGYPKSPSKAPSAGTRSRHSWEAGHQLAEVISPESSRKSCSTKATLRTTAQSSKPDRLRSAKCLSGIDRRSATLSAKGFSKARAAIFEASMIAEQARKEVEEYEHEKSQSLISLCKEAKKASEDAQQAQETLRMVAEKVQKEVELDRISNIFRARLNRAERASYDLAIAELEPDFAKTRNIAKKMLARRLTGRREIRGKGKLEKVWLIVSTPIVAVNDVNVQEKLIKLNSLNPEKLILAFDWKGTSNARKADDPKWTAFFKSCKAFSPSGFESEESFRIARQELYTTLWLHIYMGMIKGHARAIVEASDQKIPVRCVAIEGGPISRCESHLMPLIVHETIEELAGLGRKDADIQIVNVRSYEEFEEKMNGELKETPYSAEDIKALRKELHDAIEEKNKEKEERLAKEQEEEKNALEEAGISREVLHEIFRDDIEKLTKEDGGHNYSKCGECPSCASGRSTSSSRGCPDPYYRNHRRRENCTVDGCKCKFLHLFRFLDTS